jgi:hypothetical protein
MPVFSEMMSYHHEQVVFGYDPEAGGGDLNRRGAVHTVVCLSAAVCRESSRCNE